MDVDWVLDELRSFEVSTELRPVLKTPGVPRVSTSYRSTLSSESDIVKKAQVVEQILDRVLPNWRTEVPKKERVNRWMQHHEAVQRAIVVLERQAEVDEKLGDSSPRLIASHLHPWVWDAARSSWQAGFYRHAVTDALMRINRETQRKSGRTNLSEGDLFVQVFSREDSTPDSPRLRLVDRSNPKTFQSVHRGVASFAEGLYAAVRNPLSHAEQEISEDQALEYLASMSVLARWVDAAKVER